MLGFMQASFWYAPSTQTIDCSDRVARECPTESEPLHTGQYSLIALRSSFLERSLEHNPPKKIIASATSVLRRVYQLIPGRAVPTLRFHYVIFRGG
jgi:hypothetical protein